LVIELETFNVDLHSFILFLTSIHQFIFTNPRIFSNEIWCYDYINDAVKCILMPPQDLKKRWIDFNQSINKYLNNKIVDGRIGELMSRTRYLLLLIHVVARIH